MSSDSDVVLWSVYFMPVLAAGKTYALYAYYWTCGSVLFVEQNKQNKQNRAVLFVLFVATSGKIF